MCYLPKSMSARKTLLRLSLAALVVAVVGVNGLGCSSDDHDHDDDTTQVPDTVTFDGAVNDEAYAAIAGLAPKQDDAKAGAITAPMDGAKIPAATPPTFTWTASTARLELPLRDRDPRAPSFDPLFLLRGERSAHAHGTPFTGTAYLVTFSSGGTKLVELLTSKTSWIPDGTSWDKLKAAKAPISVSLVAAKMDNNAVTADGGPFASSKTVTFTIE